MGGAENIPTCYNRHPQEGRLRNGGAGLAGHQPPVATAKIIILVRDPPFPCRLGLQQQLSSSTGGAASRSREFSFKIEALQNLAQQICRNPYSPIAACEPGQTPLPPPPTPAVPRCLRTPHALVVRGAFLSETIDDRERGLQGARVGAHGEDSALRALGGRGSRGKQEGGRGLEAGSSRQGGAFRPRGEVPATPFEGLACSQLFYFFRRM